MYTTQSTTTLRLTFPGFVKVINKHYAWISYLASEQWYADMKALFQSAKNQQKILRFVRKTVLEEIYQAYDPVSYQRTDNLLNSMKVEILDSILAGLVVYSDVTVAPAKGEKCAEMSYALFFEDWIYDTFIPPHAKPLRPFVGKIVEFIEKWAEPAAMDAWMRAAKKKAPKFQPASES